MSDDTYQGWTNRETWALNLWLTNDQSLYEMTRERAREAVELAISNARHAGFGTTGPGTRFYSTQAWLESDLGRSYLARKAGEAVEEFWDELTDPSEGLMSVENILTMVRDIGSDYRVNWNELGEFWLSDIAENYPGHDDSESQS